MANLIDSSTGTLSFWMRKGENSQSGIGYILCFFANYYHRPLYIYVSLDGELHIFLAESSYHIKSDTPGIVQRLTEWHHVLCSWDISGGSFIGNLYIDDVSHLFLPVETNASPMTIIEWSQTTGYSIFSEFLRHNTNNGYSSFYGSIGGLWMSCQEYLDFSIVENRRKFVSATIKPVFLGVNGEFPLGESPSFYHTGKKNYIATNRGTGQLGDASIPILKGSVRDCSHFPPLYQ